MKTHEEKIQEIVKSNFSYPFRYSNLSGIFKYYSTLGKNISTELEQNVKNAFNFVDKIYPDANVKQANVFLTSPYLLRTYGYNGIGGFYDVKTRNIIISSYIIDNESVEFSVQGEYELDEILCHELIHYSSMAVSPVSSVFLEEEIAYGKSSIYLNEKGKDIDWIIRKNMMPYLVNIVDKNKITTKLVEKLDPFRIASSEKTVEILVKNNYNKWFELLIDEAYVLGYNMLRNYLNISNNENKTIIEKKINLDDEF